MERNPVCPTSRWIRGLALYLGCIAGCSGDSGVSVWDLRHAEAPLKSELIEIQHLMINGQPVLPVTHRAESFPGATLRLSGQIRKGEWGISRIKRIWEESSSDEVTIVGPRIEPQDKPLFFGATLYGASSGPDLNVFLRTYVQVRWFPEEQQTRIRADIVLPDRPGEYVLELDLTDKSVQPKRGETTPAIPVWRCAIVLPN